MCPDRIPDDIHRKKKSQNIQVYIQERVSGKSSD